MHPIYNHPTKPMIIHYFFFQTEWKVGELLTNSWFAWTVPAPALIQHVVSGKADSSVDFRAHTMWYSRKKKRFLFKNSDNNASHHFVHMFICHCGLTTHIFCLNSPWCYRAHMWPVCSFCNSDWFLWHDFFSLNGKCGLVCNLDFDIM